MKPCVYEHLIYIQLHLLMCTQGTMSIPLYEFKVTSVLKKTAFNPYDC